MSDCPFCDYAGPSWVLFDSGDCIMTGAKPAAFCRWILAMLGYVAGDQVDDLFPGTGVMNEVLAQGVLVLNDKAKEG